MLPTLKYLRFKLSDVTHYISASRTAVKVGRLSDPSASILRKIDGPVSTARASPRNITTASD